MILRFGNRCTNVGVDLYNVFHSNTPTIYEAVYDPASAGDWSGRWRSCNQDSCASMCNSTSEMDSPMSSVSARKSVTRVWAGVLMALFVFPRIARAADPPIVQAAAAVNGAVVRSLIEQGADVNVQGSDGATALLWIARTDDLETAAVLLKVGAKVAIPNALGITPVYAAAEQGNAAMLRRLLDAGASVTTTDAGGDTLLMAAVRAGNPDAVQLLLDRGAPVNAAEPQYSHTALMWAVSRDDEAIMKLLIAKGATIDTATRVGPKPAARPPQARAAVPTVSASFAAACRRRASSSRRRAA
jgi:hypothetical protein